MRNIQTREGYDLWDKVHELPRFNFWRGGEDEKGSVIRVPDKHGHWVSFNDLTTLADQYQDEINSLRDRLARLEPKAVALEKMGGEILACDQLPYPATPRIHIERADFPSFCFEPHKCKGYRSCPQHYSCTE